MDRYIDWEDASKTPSESIQKPQPSTSGQAASVAWQNASYGISTNMQNPYDVETSRDSQQMHNHVNVDYGQGMYRSQYTTGASISPSTSPVGDSAVQSHNYTSGNAARSQGQQNLTAASASQNTPSHHSSMNFSSTANQIYNHPYTYANGMNPYNHTYAQNANPQATYISAYNPQSYQTGASGVNGRYPGQGQISATQANSALQPQQSYQYQYAAPQAQAQAYPPQQPYPQSQYSQNQYSQYQRPEDALQRAQQNWGGQKVHGTINSPIYHGQPLYSQWQNGPGQPVYFGMDARPIAPNKIAAPVISKPTRPSSPPRPQEPLAALRYDVSHCLNDYNTSRDIKGCAGALLAIMATCDPVMPASKDEMNSAKKDDPVEKSSSTAKATELDPKIKQTALLSVVHSEIKGPMVEEVCNNKSIRAKLRTWFVRAHKDNSFIVLKSLILVLNKLTQLSALSLAEVKFGKAIMIVSRKCVDTEIKELLAPWTAKAEESLVIERQLDAAVEEEEKKKAAKQSASTTSAAKSDVKSPPTIQSTAVKKSDVKAKVGLTKKMSEPVAKSNAAFFKKEALAPIKPVVAKPGMAATLASIKARKRSDTEKPSGDSQNDKVTATKTTNSADTNTPSKNLAAGKNAFSALKLVEGLKRTVSPNVSKDMEPVSKKLKQKKRVSWRPDLELEQIQIFESVEPEGGWESVHTPHQYGNARDLDRKEGAILHRGILPDREEEFIDWDVPKVLDLLHKGLATGRETRGPKTAGTLTISSKANEAAEARESTVFLAAYASEEDIPWSPSETLAVHDIEIQTYSKPKNIPLPQELRDDWRVRQILGDLADAGSIAETSSNAYVQNSTPAPMAAPIEVPSASASATQPDITAILAGILAAQQGNTAGMSMTQNAPVPSINLASNNEGSTSSVNPPLPPPPMIVDPKLADFLRMAAAGNPMSETPPFPPVPTAETQQQQQHQQSYSDGNSESHPLPAQFGGLRDVRPWVRYNDNGRYREPCRFIALGKCDKGMACGYLHLDGPGHRA